MEWKKEYTTHTKIRYFPLDDEEEEGERGPLFFFSS